MGVLSLPPETFGLFKGVGKASVLFLEKSPNGAFGHVWFGLSACIGWDATGRETGPVDVVDVAIAMREQRAEVGKVETREGADLARNMSAEWNLRSEAAGVRLGDLVETAFTGRTAPRSAYCEPDSDGNVFRTIKVGNLTGAGLDWSPGERGFATFKESPPMLLFSRTTSFSPRLPTIRVTSQRRWTSSTRSLRAGNRVASLQANSWSSALDRAGSIRARSFCG